MAAAKGTPSVSGDRNPLRMVLFILSIGLCFLCFYLILDFQGSAQSKLSGELILGQVDSASYNHKDAPILGFFFEYFGVLTYLFAAMIVYLGYFLVLKPIDIWHADFYKACLRLLGFNCTLIGLSGILSRYFDIGFTGAGGLLGDMLNMFCDLALPSILSVFIFAITVFCGLSMLWGRNPFFIFDRVGDLFFKVLPAKSNTNGKKHNTHHSLAQDDNDLTLDQNTLGAAALATGVMASATASAKEQDMAQDLSQDMSQDMALEQNGSLPNADELNVASEDKVLPDLESLAQQQLSADNNMSPIAAADSHGMETNGSQEAQDGFFAQVMNSEYGRMSPNDQSAVNNEPYQALEQDNQVLAQDLEQTQSPVQNQAQGYEMGQEMSQGQGQVQGQSQVQGLGEVPQQAMAQDNEQGYYENNEELINSAAQNVAPYSESYAEPSSELNNNLGTAIDPNESFINSNNQAAVQLFANEMQSEEDNSFNNALAGLEPQEDLSQVPPMPNLNNTQESTPEPGQDFFAFANEQNNMQNQAMQDELYPLPDQTQSSGMAQAQGLGQAQAPAQAQAAAQTAAQSPASVPAIESDQVFISNAAIDDIGTQPALEQNLDLANTKVESGVDFNAEVAPNQFSSNMNGSYQQGSFDQGTDIPVSTFKDAQMPMNNEQVELPQQDMGQGSYANELVPEATLESAPIQSQDDAQAYTQAREQALEPAPTTVPTNNLATENSLPQDSDLGSEGASDNGPSTLISSGASVAQADAIAATAATADAVPVAAANASTVNGVVAAMAAEGTGVTAAAGGIASAVGGLAAKEALADVAATAATAVSAAAATANNTVKDDKKEKGEPDSPYGYGSYAAKHALVPSVALEDSNNESDDGSDSEAVHTIVQRTDPKVIAAQIAAQNKEKEERERKRREEQERKEQAERERKEQEAAQRKAQELQEAQAKAEAEAKARAEAEAQAQAQAQAMAQSHEQESGTSASASASAGDNTTDGLPQSDDDQYEYVYEEDDEAPIYAGTYAARLAREKAAQNGQPLNKRRLKKINRDTGEEVIDLAEPNTHDIGVDLPLEERPRTIIRDSRNDAEDISSKTNNYYPSAKNTNNSVPEHNNAEQASGLSEQVADSSNQDQQSDSLNGASNDDSEGPHLSSQLSDSVSDGQEAPKNELIETLSNLASEMDDAKLQHFNEHQDLGMSNSDEQSFNFDKLEQGANTHANTSDNTNTNTNTNTNAYDNAEVNNTEDDIVSTNIQMGSGSPVPESQKFNQGNISTNITRSNAATDASLDNDSDFFRFATTRDNELQAKNGEQNNASNAVDVNLFDDDYDKPYVPKHVYDFGGKEVGHIDESLSGTEGGSDDEFVTGAAVEDKTLPGQGGFDFARFVTSSEENSESNSTSVSTSASDESKDLSQEQEDNIISFNKFDEPKKSYEVGSLSSAFIPMEDEGHDSQVSKGNSLFGDYDYVHDSYENKVKEQQLKQEVKAEAEDKAETEAEAQVKSEIATYEDAQLSENNAEDYQEDAQNEQYQDDEEYQEGQYSDGQFPVGANGFDQGMMANQMEAFNNAQMMNNQAMYNPMANQMPNGQQVQYMQLPNGQYVPVMPNAMNNMAPNMMYPNMANPNMPMGQVQYMQLPNGQYVPVMPNAMNNMAPNMMYQNMAANNMAMAGAMPNMPMANNQQANMLPGSYEPANTNDNQLHLQDNMPGNGFVSGQVEASDAHSMGEHGPSGVGLPTAGNAFMGAHNSSSSNLPSYMAGVSQGAGSGGAARTERSSLALCSVPRHRYDSWRPSLDLLARSNSHVDISLDELNKTSERINDVLHSFGIKATVADYLTGPVITRFDLDLAPGVKSTAISSIETELCRNLMVPNVRVVPIVEGSSYVGLEVPNPQRQFITLADMASSREFQESKASLPMCLGASVVGAPVVKDLAECPHLLVAGTTGSGKSAGLNTMLISLLLKRSPSELRLILVDPKQLEFSIYKDLPHLITPVITDVAEKTPIALRWCVDEMERRFKLMSMLGVRKLSEYNDLIKSKAANGQSVADPLWNKDFSPQPQALEPLPWIVVVVEEFADLMAQSGRKKDKESTPDGLIARLSAKSRAAGIHLVLVTQTPRSEVVTGMIKANFPSRVAFTVQNRLDSTIVLDEKGAECLLGNGDMLYKFPGEGTATRAHGSFTSNDDVKAVVDAWKEYAGAPEYLEDVVAVQEEETEDPAENKAKELDVKFDQAVEVVREYMDRRNKPPTVTDLQTELGVGYPRAKKIFMQLSREGIID
ncbi:hypothetical protein MXE38_05230 [Anaerobiospirillum sp. NML120448]|uniref:DNA translocase FtsK n=1 Tax=Anaerobiospirillum sp. NML120448 TaxID=2932816 RepID=UPI001FF2BDA4|nr:DNA translocase FtsK [Anaerobiospirillum sp. NML120448]MCK0514265.1 hypothetical protein [Anaerobiospirillum sp. NML120448]